MTYDVGYISANLPGNDALDFEEAYVGFNIYGLVFFTLMVKMMVLHTVRLVTQLMQVLFLLVSLMENMKTLATTC